MDATKSLIIIADDFGVGPATSKGILKLAVLGRVTGAGLVVNSPYAEESIREWRKLSEPVELGWQPCLTMDQPVLPATQVSSLVAPDGRFLSLGQFLRKLAHGRILRGEVQAELEAQWHCFGELVGAPPAFVTGHEQVQLLPIVGRELLDLLSAQSSKPYFRRVRESLLQWIAVPGGRWKRLLTSTLGRRFRVKQERAGIPGNDFITGLTDAGTIAKAELLSLWLTWTPGQIVELACRPGYRDATLLQRAVRPSVVPSFFRHVGAGYSIEEQLEQRVQTLEMLQHSQFEAVLTASGRRLVAPSSLVNREMAPELRLVA